MLKNENALNQIQRAKIKKKCLFHAFTVYTARTWKINQNIMSKQGMAWFTAQTVQIKHIWADLVPSMP